MKALTYSPENDQFVVRSLIMPKASGLDVVVKVFACGLNPVDTKIYRWKDMVSNMTGDFVGGLDVAGEIIEVGDAVSEWSVGDKVLYHGDMLRNCGGFAEYALQDSLALTAMPKVHPEIAAATPCAGWTAFRALVDKLNVQKHKSIFIAGGSGGVGGFAIQLAKHFGVECIITTSSAINHDYVLGLGATHVIDYREQNVVEAVMDITHGEGVPIALDTVGGDNDIICASVLSYEGEMVELVRTVRPENYPNAFKKGLSFHQLSLGSGHRYGQKAKRELVKAGEEFNLLLEQGKIKIPILQSVSLNDTGMVLKAMREQRTVGKIVLSF